MINRLKGARLCSWRGSVLKESLLLLSTTVGFAKSFMECFRHIAEVWTFSRYEAAGSHWFMHSFVHSFICSANVDCVAIVHQALLWARGSIGSAKTDWPPSLRSCSEVVGVVDVKQLITHVREHRHTQVRRGGWGGCSEVRMLVVCHGYLEAEMPEPGYG